MVTRDRLITYLDGVLKPPAALRDSSNNGLQVEGVQHVERVAFGVDASLALFREAAEWDAQALVVHHGISWGNGFARIIGPDAARLSILLHHGISLYASHIPLDCHPDMGNNAMIARKLGLDQTVPFGTYGGIDIGIKATLPKPLTVQRLATRIERALATTCRVLSPEAGVDVCTVGIVSGGGADIVSQCVAAGVDCLLTGEIAHQNVHPAMEAHTPIIAAGHYATETWGLRALCEHVAEALELDCRFLDLPTGY